MADRAAFPDVEVALVTLLDDLGSTGTVTPSDLQSALPFIRIQRFGGEDDRWTDSALVAIDAFAATRSVARSLAESIRQRLLTGPNLAGSTVIDMASTATAPNEVPWSDDPNVRRFTASYRVSVRR